MPLMGEPPVDGALFAEPPTPTSRHPHEVFLAALSMLSGAGSLFTPARPGSIRAIAPEWIAVTWSLTLILGGAVCIIGVSLTNRGMRLLVERASMLFLGFSAPAYSFAVIATVGLRGLYPAAITLAFGAACIWRWVQITRELKTGHQ